jgi:hypothetical protein
LDWKNKQPQTKSHRDKETAMNSATTDKKVTVVFYIRRKKEKALALFLFFQEFEESSDHEFYTFRIKESTLILYYPDMSEKEKCDAYKAISTLDNKKVASFKEEIAKTKLIPSEPENGHEWSPQTII